ncbi:MAG: peptidase S41 [Bacteroides sp.]|nr:peptidase S41 [Bacteroides sp.]
MKRLSYTLYLCTLLALSSCGEDRTGEFYALIEDRMWIEETMKEHYLWYEHMPVIEDEDDYFTQASTFFKNMLYKEALDGKGDSYSYMEEIQTEEETEARSLYLNRTSTYGMEFELMRDPLKGTTHTLARILYVLPGSPAEKAGIKRGDWLTTIGRKQITTDNYTALMYGGSASFGRDRVAINEEGNYIWQAVDTVTVSASVLMEINPFLKDTVYQVNGQRIAYLVYNEFATGPQNEGTETVYHEQMKQIFARFKAQQPDAFILDLRYNPGGFLSCAQVLGSLLAPSSSLGKDFIKLEFNDKSDPQVVNYAFNPEYADANLNLDKIYILTSQYTASASEAVINGLKPYMGEENVVVIGEQTEGKNVAMQSFKDERFNYVLWPVVAYVFNANNEGDYTNGFTPRYELNERGLVSEWYPLGDEREFFLKNTLSLITTGTMPDIETEENNTEVQSVLNSIEKRNIQGFRIR